MNKSVSFNESNNTIFTSKMYDIQNKELWYTKRELKEIKTSLIHEIKIIKGFNVDVPQSYPKLKTSHTRNS